MAGRRKQTPKSVPLLSKAPAELTQREEAELRKILASRECERAAIMSERIDTLEGEIRSEAEKAATPEGRAAYLELLRRIFSVERHERILKHMEGGKDES
jgi:hypothetical protein